MKEEKKLNIPNVLTVARIWAIPLIVIALYFSKSLTASWIAVVLFALAGITDYFDGYLARHLNQLSSFGRVLDPIADKLLVGAVIVMLAYTNRLDSYYCFVPAVIILCREILVSGLREFLAEIRVGLPVTRLAKWKTTFQMIALPVLMVSDKVLACIYLALNRDYMCSQIMGGHAFAAQVCRCCKLHCRTHQTFLPSQVPSSPCGILGKLTLPMLRPAGSMPTVCRR